MTDDVEGTEPRARLIAVLRRVEVFPHGLPSPYEHGNGWWWHFLLDRPGWASLQRLRSLRASSPLRFPPPDDLRAM